MFSLLGLLSYVVLWAPGGEAIGVDAATAAANALFRLDLGFIVFVLGSLFAIKTDFKLSIPFILMSYLMYLTSRQVPLAILGAIQAIGWFFQLYGHYKYEKKSPAFFKSLEHLFVGPMWLFARMIGYY